MNTEPPQGDDLQRMLVSMKQNVLERATPLRKRRRGRSGIVIGVVTLLAVGTATGAVALTLSQQNADPVAAPTQAQQPEPSPSATTPSSAPITGTPVPKPTPTPLNTTATIPSDCRAVVPASEYSRFFGDITATERDVQTSTDGGDGIAATALSCEWRKPGADGGVLYVTVGTTTAEQAQNQVDTFGDEAGGTCTERPDGTLCQLRATLDDGVAKAYTLYVRGDSYVVVDQIGFPTDNLLGAIVGEIWGD
ncbi:superantigen-like protein SSL4 [Curtobacterium poinsettiae]|uniref:DUF3558 domain-containing protein n=1 Tax=Curtobacterium poinsettiae TaxID=159612 RepID=A0ABT3S4G8_9MICO|nr:hypothetical protein [Curtobacterium flaccumfaciens]MBT1610160.1 hypothetical protein [Curtobacterium flaccumfaciens pv. poinsettiae]MCX2849720.1 hypothetical protein [Curtobacterium flaccumfaciens pv. poinsettiae]UXN19331.1 hypothetical protein N8D78_04240 [Curtobacterium flaccumfaciens pv. poinsettiae]